MMRPEHCVFYSINLKEDFWAECNLCEDGFIKDKNYFQTLIEQLNKTHKILNGLMKKSRSFYSKF